MILSIIVLSLMGFVGYLGWRAFVGYRAAEGTVRERLWAGFRDSATIAWNVGNAVSVTLISAVTWLSDVLGYPGLKDTVTPLLTPKLVIAYLLILAIGSVAARSRTL